MSGNLREERDEALRRWHNAAKEGERLLAELTTVQEALDFTQKDVDLLEEEAVWNREVESDLDTADDLQHLATRIRRALAAKEP